MLIIGNLSKNFSNYGINSNVSNVLFSYENGTGIPCWIQTVNNTSVVFWLKLDKYISQTIYMNVYPNNFNLFEIGSSHLLGEAPAYGQSRIIDNGNSVFDTGGAFYQDFSGSVLPSGFTTSGSYISGNYTVDDGIYILNRGGSIFTSQSFGSGIIYSNASLSLDGATAAFGFGWGGLDYWFGMTGGSYPSFAIGTTNSTGFTQTGTNVLVNSTFELYREEWINGSLFEVYNSTERQTANTYLTNNPMPIGIASQGGNGYIRISWFLFIPISVINNMPAYSIYRYNKIELYTVKFSENGLLSGTEWSVDLGNFMKSSVSQSIVFEVANGTYSCSIGGPPGFSNSLSLSNLSVQGADLSIPVTFSKVYSVTFQESGLTEGTRWKVILANETQSSANSSITFHLLNGTYFYSVPKVVGTLLANSSGKITLDGQNVKIFINFQETTQFTFIETGLPSGTHWGVEINGKYYSTSLPFIVVNLTKGSYFYEVTLPYGYTARLDNGILNFNSTIVIVNVYFYISYEIGVTVSAGLIAVVLLLRNTSRKKNRAQKK
jgi:hypothetical protein